MSGSVNIHLPRGPESSQLMCGLPIARAVLKASAASGPDVKQVDFIFAGSHSHQATADGSIRDRMTRLGGGFCGKSMRRSIIFLWINSVHAHQMGAEDGTGVCVCLCVPRGGISITSAVGQRRWRSCITVKYAQTCSAIQSACGA